ncbi:MAG: Holliday junction resolvase RuvX [Saprospiraceae bacterium]|jgi:putative Holliday junction resolvase|nr:Holliday junction resolvase RuvX [Saprospiraceae bacterium]MBK6480672.1 Holliday junction resolvase RuvX [Saprospiraceae bacterium]MBK6816967.1 Holliday junction resolvase RuvX [Saprospiraceae bacterium]MBK7371497.1 Holliday junction resolvase RuvX [Saprospiraceae bacterium]MBK7436008.1 Holliday junction resolvase RuvX [Saprospiraceae bacterium]
MARALGVDYGKKRTGLSVTDPLKMIVNPLTAIATDELDLFLINYLGREQVDLVVFGDPFHKDGTPTELNFDIHTFGNSLLNRFPYLTIRYQVENFTSQEAVSLLIKKGTPKNKRDKSAIDVMSAVLILQKYLNHY